MKPNQTTDTKEQQQPAVTSEKQMEHTPVVDDVNHKPSGKLKGKIALITGGGSGIGKAVAILFAKEGAKVVINYYKGDEDAKDAEALIKKYGGESLLIQGDISEEAFCRQLVEQTIQHFGRIDILVNNAGTQHHTESIEDIKTEDLIRTFQVNVFAMIWITQSAIPHMPKGSSIINTTSVTAYQGHGQLLDYSATKGAIVAFTRSLSASLAHKEIRVNGVAPGPIWTPLAMSSFDKESNKHHGEDTPLQRAGEPAEVAPSYLFLASKDASYMTGQVLHPNGGSIING
ncbi:glucose 1-dehydrogenase [Niastella sp. OAS944]|uniref:glucose 1-dehydrogenase n=1 Tax=Niastella sp. OAS944 TaxID=2664089 RepID=UPI003483688C|nr:NAD(P)-dependent dehydrogenase (short-subunit alcohol dehydrogenase family) [Chitinophagaceae bacterium OAS944]